MTPNHSIGPIHNCGPDPLVHYSLLRLIGHCMISRVKRLRFWTFTYKHPPIHCWPLKDHMLRPRSSVSLLKSSNLLCIAIVLWQFCEVACSQNSAPASTRTTQQAAKFLSQTAITLNTREVPPNWDGFPELSTLSAASETNRLGTLNAVVFQLDKTEALALPRANEGAVQSALSLQARTLVLTALRKVLPARSTSPNERIMQGYLEGELADLKLIQDGRIPLALYFQGKEYRDNKRTRLLMQDVDIAEVFLIASANNSAKVLTNRVFLLALMQSCAANLAACAMVLE